jgi:hypothetical protein
MTYDPTSPQPPPPEWQPPGSPPPEPPRRPWPRRHPWWWMSALSAAAVIIVIGVVAAIAAPKSSTPIAASNPASSPSPAAAQVTDPNGQTCVSLDSQGYCPGDDPTPTPSPTPSGPAQFAIGQAETLGDNSNATIGTVTVLSATVTTQPADPSFGQAPANGYYVVVHLTATADNSYTSGFNVNGLDFYAKEAGQHYDYGNGNSFQALSNNQSNQSITATLAAGETVSGWTAFDVPRPHGFIVYSPNLNGQPLAEWAY